MAEGGDRSLRKARRLVWTLLVLLLAVRTIAMQWDQRYHVANPFVTFWTSPHVFGYSGYLLMVVIFLFALFWMRDLHPHLGPPLRVPPLAFPIPAPFLLVGLGLLLTGTAGSLDSKYHEALGFRETHFGLPHAMLGFSGFITVMGLIAALVAIEKSSSAPGRLHFRAGLVLGFWGMLIFASGAALGPALGIASPQLYQTLLDNPVPGTGLPIRADLRWALEIYITHGIARSHPAVVPAMAFIAAALLATLRRLAGSRWSGAGWALFYSAFTALDAAFAGADWGSFGQPGRAFTYAFPFPLLPMVAVVGLLEGRAGRWSYLVAGLLAGAMWQAGPLSILLGGAAALAGREVGRGLWRTLAEPTRRGVAVTALLLGVAVPVVLGGIDVALRAGRYWWIF